MVTLAVSLSYFSEHLHCAPQKKVNVSYSCFSEHSDAGVGVHPEDAVRAGCCKPVGGAVMGLSATSATQLPTTILPPDGWNTEQCRPSFRAGQEKHVQRQVTSVMSHEISI